MKNACQNAAGARSRLPPRQSANQNPDCLYARLDLERAKLLKRVAEIEALLEIS
jgi:hypothetical protein